MPAQALVEEALAQHRAGRLADAERLYRAALAETPDDLNALQLLGALTADSGRAAEAVLLLESAEALIAARGARPEHAPLYFNLGNALRAARRGADAVRCYRRGLALDAAMPELHAGLAAALGGAGELAAAAQEYEAAWRARPQRTDWRRALAIMHALIGITHQREGRRDAAESSYRIALRLEPDLPEALYHLGLLLLGERAQPAEAAALFERLVAVQPGHAEAQGALGSAYRALGRIDDAIAAYRRQAERAPTSPLAHLLLGRTLGETERKDEALQSLDQALALAPDPALRHLAEIDRGNALQDLGRTDEARAAFRRALAIEPVVTRRSAKSEPDFSVLFVMAPGALNTPHDYLASHANFDAHVLLLLPDTAYDAEALGAKCDVVVNLISDADRSKAILPLAAALIGRIGKPVINPPAKIATTDRESMAALLSRIRHCRVPLTLRVPGAVLAARGARADLPLPFLARLAGRHGGDAFAMIHDWSDLEDLAARHSDEDFYLIEYLDYRSRDGLFRKYRFFFVGGEILPYHLAIGRGWKVHHFRTDMAHEPALQREEAAFLAAPGAVFQKRHYDALEAIRAAVGLDFFGIDCGLDLDGNLVVFEANATMLVHDQNQGFPYKTPAARRIKAGFADLLAAAARPRPRASAA